MDRIEKFKRIYLSFTLDMQSAKWGALSLNMGRDFGLETEEEIAEYIKFHNELAKDVASAYMEQKLIVASGKPVDQIPLGDYCYETYFSKDDSRKVEEASVNHGDYSDEHIGSFLDHARIRRCPYFRCTGYGTVICDFLEEESIGVGEGCYDEALKHYGSEDLLYKHCNEDELGDSCRVCMGVIQEIKKREDGNVGKDG